MRYPFVMAFVVLGLSLPLLGCGDDSSNRNPSPPVADISPISNVMTTASVGQVHRVPIYQYVQPKEGQLLSISRVRHVEKLSSASLCPTPAINGLELVYTPNSQGVCGYEYTLTDGEHSSVGSVLSTASNFGNVTQLADISKSASIGNPLTVAITNPTPTDTLAVVTVLGSGSAYVKDNDIIFEGVAPGLARVIYTISAAAEDSAIKIGIINITVSEIDDTNTPPTAPDVSAVAAPNQIITLTPNITDVDESDNPQLIAVVSSHGATVKSVVQDGPLDESYFTNKNFSFMATTPGIYTAYYTVHDHRGGYNTGKATVNVSGEIGLIARDASFYRDVSSSTYEFKVDLRSYVTAANPESVTYLPAEFEADSDDSNVDNIVMSSNNQLLTYKVPAKQSGTVKIKYSVKEGANQTSGTIFIAIGNALPTITTLSSAPKIDIGVTISANSTCNDCEQLKTVYEWHFQGDIISNKAQVVVPKGYRGESLILTATPYNKKGQQGVTKSTAYHYPFHAATVSINKDIAKIGESITLAVNTTHLGKPDENNQVTVKAESAINRKNMPEKLVTALVDDSLSSTKSTNINGDATFTLTDPKGKGVKTTFSVTINNQQSNSEQITFTVNTSPNVSSANYWGHMPDNVIIDERNFYRPPLKSELVGAAGISNTENNEVWGLMQQTDARSYCANNYPESVDMQELYIAYPLNTITTKLGWPSQIYYGTNTDNNVINMLNGNVISQPNYQAYVSCANLLAIDSTGVTIDILKEDGSYTNDKYLPSSTIMSYGALMFPGAGIRINLPNAVIENTIKVQAPKGYQSNTIGKSVQLTDMMSADYKDQIITVTGLNSSGDLLGLRLKVSSTKYQDIKKEDYIPKPELSGLLKIKRDNTFPSHKISWYQHGLVVKQRYSAYFAAIGKTQRGTEFENIIKTRFDVGSTNDMTTGNSSISLFLYFIPESKSDSWLYSIINSRLAQPENSTIVVSKLSDVKQSLRSWVTWIGQTVAPYIDDIFVPYLVEMTTPYPTPTSQLPNFNSTTVITSDETLRLCPDAKGETSPAINQAITKFDYGVLPVAPTSMYSNLEIMELQYRGVIKGLEPFGWVGEGGYGNLISETSIIVLADGSIHLGCDEITCSYLSPWLGDAAAVPAESPESIPHSDFLSVPQVWGFATSTELRYNDVVAAAVREGRGDEVLIDISNNDPSYNDPLTTASIRAARNCVPGTEEFIRQLTVREVHEYCSTMIKSNCGLVVSLLDEGIKGSRSIILEENNQIVGEAVKVSGTPEEKTRKTPIK